MNICSDDLFIPCTGDGEDEIGESEDEDDIAEIEDGGEIDDDNVVGKESTYNIIYLFFFNIIRIYSV